jgi:cytidyltransferase-like protein
MAKSFKQFVEEKSKQKTVVVYGGRFQPMHPGHYAVYKDLCEKFGFKNVVIATSNKVNYDPKDDINPFDFENKKQIMTSIFGIDESKIILAKNPTFRFDEVAEASDGPVAIVTVCGLKDKERYEKAKNFKQFEEGSSLSFLDDYTKTVYFLPIEMKEDGLSATDVRKVILDNSESKAKKELERIYGVEIPEDTFKLMVDQIKKIRSE